MKTIYLIRHGQYNVKPWQSLGSSFSLEQLLLTTDGPLTDTGVSQSMAVGARLAHLDLAAIHCSSLKRTVETAEHIGKVFPNVPIVKSDMLWECIPVQHATPTEDVALLGTDDIEQSRIRSDQAYDKYIQAEDKADTTELVICHGNIIKYFVTRILSLPLIAWTWIDVVNCGITKVGVNEDGVRLLSFNDTGHLSPELETFT